MIPVLDARSADFAVELCRASRDVGFVSVTGHGIPTELFERVRASLRALFALSDDEKAALRIQPRNYRGFIPLGFFTPNRAEANGDLKISLRLRRILTAGSSGSRRGPATLEA